MKPAQLFLPRPPTPSGSFPLSSYHPPTSRASCGPAPLPSSLRKGGQSCLWSMAGPSTHVHAICSRLIPNDYPWTLPTPFSPASSSWYSHVFRFHLTPPCASFSGLCPQTTVFHGRNCPKTHRRLLTPLSDSPLPPSPLQFVFCPQSSAEVQPSEVFLIALLRATQSFGSIWRCWSKGSSSTPFFPSIPESAPAPVHVFCS